MQEKTYAVYKHTGPQGKVYIGITSQTPARRWHGGSAYRSNKHFLSAIKKYGWENFNHEILYTGLSYEDACALEIELIKSHDSTNPAKGYNLSQGGDKTTYGYHLSEETRRKISEALTGKRKGIPHSKAHIDRISAALKGRTVPESTRSKLREVMGDRFQTKEARDKQKRNTPRGAAHARATAVVCEETNKVYATIIEASKDTGIYRNGIALACKGKQATAGGLHWKFKK